MNSNSKFISPKSLSALKHYRVGNILLVSTLYDAFILEKDGQILEQIYNEFLELNLVYLPKITRVSTSAEVESILDTKKFDLVVTMMNLPDTNAFELAPKIKSKDPNIPVVLLLSDPSTIMPVREARDLPLLDGVFFWSGDTALYFAIIKCIEDKYNFANDIATGLVKIILVVDDSIKYYSKFLPVVYGEIMKQTQRLIHDGLNDVQKVMRMRARPEILLATNYEDAVQIFDNYSEDILGIISDISFPKNGKLADTAGLQFAEHARGKIPDIPIILMSAEDSNAKHAQKLEIIYLNKNSPNLQRDLKDFIKLYMGFGDFVFRLKNGTEVGRASSIKQLQEMLRTLPDESLLYHASKNHISLWLMARGEYEIAHEFRPKRLFDVGNNVKCLREYLVSTIASYRDEEQTGLVVRYKAGDWDSTFIQIGNGSLGGKSRGIAFVNYLLATSKIRYRFKNVRIKIPKTVAITVEEFDEFIDRNQLQDSLFLEDDLAIARNFLRGNLAPRLEAILKDFLLQCKVPLAVRSSSLLEDSQFLPFAGIYSTYMLANNHKDVDVRLKHLMRAIKLVYASVFFKRSKSYIASTPYKIDEEKMGIVIQEIVGEQYGNYFYPVFSGVAQSYNYYPISYMQPTEGVVQIALGLGRLVIEGGNCLRFSPRYPELIPQFATIPETFRSTQKKFYALDLNSDADNISTDDSITLASLDVARENRQKMLNLISSVYDIEDNTFQEDCFARGPRVITFANILKYKMFPLCDIVLELQTLLKMAIGKDIEMEFAVNIYNNSNAQPVFNVLQVRPLVINQQQITILPEETLNENVICKCDHALGNGIIRLSDIVFVPPDRFDAAKTREIAEQIAKINRNLQQQKRHYLLIGMGRWGTADPWLGIPVEWEDISFVKAIIETDTQNFYAEPSQGSHFFQNITSRGIGYFCLTQNQESNYLNWDYIMSLPLVQDLGLAMHVRSKTHIKIKIDGKTRQSVILKAKASQCRTCSCQETCFYGLDQCNNRGDDKEF